MRTSVFLGLVLASGTTCGSENGTNPNCLKLEPQGPISVDSEAKVSAFFRVTDCGGNSLDRTLSTDDFSLTENGNKLSSESQHYIAPNTLRLRSDILLLLDVSQSIHGDLGELAVAAKAFVGAILPEGGNRNSESVFISIYTLDGLEDIKQLSEPSNDGKDLALKISLISSADACKSNGFCRDPSTNLNGGIINAVFELRNFSYLAETDGISLTESSLVVFTDGSDQAGWKSQDEALGVLSASGVHSFAVGLRGDDLDEMALAEFGPDGQFFAENVTELTTAFSKIGRRVESIANSYYSLQYCSPKRKGKNHILEVTASSGGLTGSFSNQFSVDNWSGRICIAEPTDPLTTDSTETGGTGLEETEGTATGDTETTATVELTGTTGELETSSFCRPVSESPDACPVGNICCSDDPAATQARLPNYSDGIDDSTYGTPIFSFLNSNLSYSGKCFTPLDSSFLNGCPTPCNPTWTEIQVSKICGPGTVCCPSQELDQVRDCVLDPNTSKWRAVRGADIPELTQWGDKHTTNQDPYGESCMLFSENDSNKLADCYQQLTVADQRGFCSTSCSCYEDLCDMKNPGWQPRCK